MALAVLGACSQMAQALLARELLVAFHGNEVTLGAFFGAWLAWVAAGALTAAALHRRGRPADPRAALRACLLALPFALALQLAGVRAIRGFFAAPAAELLPLGSLLFATLLITMPASFVAGFAFPLSCRVLTGPGSTPAAQREGVTRLYVFEALGALAGGVLFTFALVPRLGAWATLGVVALLLASGAWALSTPGRPGRRAPAILALLGLVLAATPLGRVAEQASDRARFATLHPHMELLDALQTRYGHVALARLGEQVSVLTDGRISESFPDRQSEARRAAYLYTQSAGARRVLLLGPMAGGLAAELLRYPLARLDVVVEDRRAFQHVRPYLPPDTARGLEDPRLRLHFEDGRRFVNRLPSSARYDLVLALVSDPSSARLNRYFTLDFYRRAARAMSRRGVLCTEVRSAENYLGRDVRSYGASVFHTLRAVFPHVSVAPGDVHTLCASTSAGVVSTDPATLARRYLATDVRGRTFPAASFASLLPADHVTQVRRALESQRSAIDTDARPVTYFLEMLMWGRYTASGFAGALRGLARMGSWTYLIPLGVFLLLFVSRSTLDAPPRRALLHTSGTFALFALGFAAMACQLLLLLSYQARVGFVFGRIALLNGTFMAGLAIGAGLVGRRLAAKRGAGHALTSILLATAGAYAALPWLLRSISGLDGAWLEAAYLALVTGAGLLAGSGFPLGVRPIHAARRDVVHSGGLAEAADHAGGALGGLTAGTLMVPLLGTSQSCDVLVGVVLAAAAVVAFSQVAPAGGHRPESALGRRSFASFPFGRLSFALALIALSVLGLSSVARSTAPGPVLRFGDQALAAVSGSQRWTPRDEPFVHYVGQDTPATVSLSTMTVAADVEGYAGPLNLLVSVDDAGVLRGAAYVGSDETPSYIDGIDAWLATLRGRDLSRGSLGAGNVDVMTGATISSEAALEAIDRSAAAGAKEAFGLDLAAAREPSAMQVLRSPRALLTALLLLLFVPVLLRGGDRGRLAYQVAALVLLGCVFNSLLTEVELAHLSLGHMPSWRSNPSSVLLIVFVGVTSLLWGQVYCGYVCPFGALQELLSRLGRGLGLRAYAGKRLDRRLRYLKYVLLVLILVGFWCTGEVGWVTLDPMQHLFALDLGGWIGLVAGVSLVGALFFYRFWCRYFCPLGALLSFANKLALLQHRAPARRIERCDLGVRAEHDVDCIRCGRCIGGADLGVGPRHRRA